ncbi:hypothetical protein FOZ61_005268, partial [Perkinsus olseni]
SGDLPPLTLTVRSDNRPTVQWVQGHGSISRSSLERRAVLRTLNALKDELDYLKTLGSGTIVIEHIEGKSNIMPDTLSRLFDREVPLQSGRKMKLVDALHGGSDNIADFPEIFPEPQSDTAGLSWIMRSEGAELIGEDAHDVDIYTILNALPTSDCLVSCFAADPAADEQQPKPIVESLCENNWDVNGVLNDFLYLRRVF